MSSDLPVKDFVLFVGEGDFSFSASYLQNHKVGNEHVFATCLSSSPLNTQQETNIKIILENGGSVLQDVDATKLESHPVLKQYAFCKIYFNFPHIPGKMNIRENRKLLQSFFLSAKKVLKEKGNILVSLCQGQGGTDAEVVKREWCNTWKVVALAANAGLMLCDIYPFVAEEFSGYKSTGFRGLFKAFKTEGALTHVFSHGDIASFDSKIIEDNYIEVFDRDLKRLYNMLCKKTDSPCSKLASYIFKQTSTFQSIFVKDLFFCRNHTFNTENHSNNSNLENLVFCNTCLNDILSIFLKHKRSEATTAVIFSVSCISHFNLSKLPFSHLLLIISSNEISQDLKTVLSFLKEPQTLLDESISTPWLNAGNNLKNALVVESENDTGLKFERVKIASYVYAICSVIQNNACLFYKVLEIEVKEERLNSYNGPNKYFEIAHILKLSHETNSFTSLLFNLDVLALIKYNIMDQRVLLSNQAYFSTKRCQKTLVQCFRSPSLFPPTYTHDMSFWINENFEEKKFFVIIRNIIGYLIKNVFLIDSYFDDTSKRYSRCYRFVYQSCDKIISEKFISKMHSDLRLTLAKSCNINLR